MTSWPGCYRSWPPVCISAGQELCVAAASETTWAARVAGYPCNEKTGDQIEFVAISPSATTTILIAIDQSIRTRNNWNAIYAQYLRSLLSYTSQLSSLNARSRAQQHLVGRGARQKRCTALEEGEEVDYKTADCNASDHVLIELIR